MKIIILLKALSLITNKKLVNWKEQVKFEIDNNLKKPKNIKYLLYLLV